MRLPLALLCLTATPLAAQIYPFEGAWPCEAADFTVSRIPAKASGMTTY